MSILQGQGAADATRKSNTKQEICKASLSEPKGSPGNKRPARGGKTNGDRGGKKAKRRGMEEEDEEEKEKSRTTVGQRPKNTKRRSIASKISYKEESNSDRNDDEEELPSDEEFQATSEEEDSSENEAKPRKKMAGKGMSKPNVIKNTAANKRRSSGGKIKENDKEWEDMEAEVEKGREGRAMSKETKRRGGKKEGPGEDEWLEVYLDKTSSWVCVHVEHGVEMPHLCFQNATAPITYVVSLDGNGFLKDLGRKYDPTWMTSSRKRRVEDEWWEETLKPFSGPEDERDIKEDKEVHSYYV